MPNSSTAVKTNKPKNEFIQMTVVLFAITAIVAFVLGYVNSITADKIAAVAERMKTEAMKTVMVDAETFETLNYDYPELVAEVSAAKNASGGVVGYCVNVLPSGYGGAIDMMVGISAEGILTKVQIVKLSETPGLGTRVQDASFIDQFEGKSGALDLVKGDASGSEISAISGATISSRAVTTGVNAAIEAVEALPASTVEQ